MKVCVASFAGDRLDLLKELGFAADQTNGKQKWAVAEMEMDDVLALTTKILSTGDTGVMVKPWTGNLGLDYVVFVDSAKGGFRQR